jgi:three-Cys-motif partner protein
MTGDVYMSATFFEERTEPSTVKATIVQKYFDAWSKIILPMAQRYHGGKIAYVDLYAGPGRYRDGAASTPLLVIEKALETPSVAAALVTMFNDQDENNTQTLATEIANLPGIQGLAHKPIVNQNTVGEDAADYFGKTRRVPTFTFLDPFGYKGLSLKLVNGVIKDWGCDCVFFFNYNRINAGLTNPAVKANMDALFGEESADRLRAKVAGAKPHLREEMVLEAMSEALHEMGGEYVLPFRFGNEGGRLTHHLVFVSKDFKGYDVMKSIMAKASTTADQGVPSFAYTPADESMPLLFELTRPLDDLEGMLLTEYAGRRVSMEDIYRQHSVNRPFLSKNYKEVLGKLADEGKIDTFNSKGKARRNGTFANHIHAIFPEETT